jgi:hypothetical protein
MKEGLGKTIELRRMFGPEMHENPYPVYQKLRETDPVHWDDGLQAWVLTRYDDVAWGLKNLSSDRLSVARERFRDEGLAALWDAVAALMSQKDEPDHTRLRALVQKAFYRTTGRPSSNGRRPSTAGSGRCWRRRSRAARWTSSRTSRFRCPSSSSRSSWGFPKPIASA